MLDQGLQLNAPPPQAGEQREVRRAVEGKGSKAPTSAPPHKIADFLVQPAMLGGRDLVDRALDQRGQALTGEPTDLNSPTLGFCVELRPVGEACGCRVKEPKQAAWRAVVDVGSSLGGHHAALVSPAWTSRCSRSISSAATATSGACAPEAARHSAQHASACLHARESSARRRCRPWWSGHEQRHEPFASTRYIAPPLPRTR